MFQKLKNNPYVDDQIRYKFFREKRIKEKRIYYLIYEDLQIVLIVAFRGKKHNNKRLMKLLNIFQNIDNMQKNYFLKQSFLFFLVLNRINFFQID